MRLKSIFFVLLLICIYIPSFGENINLNLKSVINTTLDRNLQIKADKETLKASKATIDEVKGVTFGSFNLNGSYMHLDEKVTAPMKTDPPISEVFPQLPITNLPNFYMGPQEQIHLLLTYGVPIYTGGALQNSIKATEYGHEAVKKGQEVKTNDLVFSAIDYYLGSLLAKDVVEVNKEALVVMNNHLKQANISFNTGVVAKYDVLRAEAAVKDQERKLEEAENDYQIAIMALKNVLNLKEEDTVVFEDSLTFPENVPNVDTLLKNAQANNPGLKALDNVTQAIGALKKAEKGSLAPQVAAVASAQLLTGNINTFEPKWMMGVDVNFNIFDGGINKAKTDQLTAKEKASVLERESTQNLINLGVNTAYLQLKTAEKSKISAESTIKLSEETLRMASKRFETGNGTSIEVLDANLILTSSKLAECLAIYQGEKAYFSIKKLCGDIIIK